MFREGWVKVNSTPTHILSWGGYIDDNIESDTILLLIPGNPGITDFYYLFLETLYKCINIPIWTINHAGSELAPKDFTQPSIEHNPELYDLKGQIAHKESFIKKYVPEGKKLILIGHSVGGKICVELLKDEKIAPRVSQVHLVFPTLQHIAESFNGKVYKNVIQYIIPFVVSLSWIFTLLPESCRRSILNAFFWLRRDWRKCHKDTCLRGVLTLFTPQVSKAALVLAKDEIHKIKGLDSEIYETHFDKIHCYYAQHDDWAPLFQYHHLIEKHPKVNGTIMDSKFTHAFVLTAPADMAEEVGKNILPCIKG